MKSPSRIAVLLVPLMVGVCASAARATPNTDAGAWDAREAPEKTTLLLETQMAATSATAAPQPTVSDGKQVVYVPIARTAVVGKGGVALTPARRDGRGLYYGNMTSGVISRGVGLVLRLF